MSRESAVDMSTVKSDQIETEHWSRIEQMILSMEKNVIARS